MQSLKHDSVYGPTGCSQGATSASTDFSSAKEEELEDSYITGYLPLLNRTETNISKHKKIQNIEHFKFVTKRKL